MLLRKRGGVAGDLLKVRVLSQDIQQPVAAVDDHGCFESRPKVKNPPVVPFSFILLMVERDALNHALKEERRQSTGTETT